MPRKIRLAESARNMSLMPNDRRRYIGAMDFLIIIPENGVLMEAIGVADILSTANRLDDRSGGDYYRVSTASARPDRTVRGSSGMQLVCDHFLGDLDPHRGYDTIFVSGGFRQDQDLQNSIIADWIALAAERTRRICSACTGAFFLARAGVLEGRRATTHWKRLGELADLHPGVRVEEDSILVADGKVLTAGGVSAAFDLGLKIVELDLGRRRALQVARQLVLYLRRPGGQTQFAHKLPENSTLDPIRRVQTWVEQEPGREAGVGLLAEKAGMSPRNFARVFAREVGMGPGEYVELVRLNAARHLLEEGELSIEEIAQKSGLRTSLRRVFLKRLGITPNQYKARFSAGVSA